MTAGRVTVIGVLMELCYISFYLIKGETGDILLFIGVNMLTFGLFAYGVYQIRTSGRLFSSGNELLGIIIGFAVLFRLTLVPHAPVASDDIYRYVWDGKVAAGGINPYARPPNDSTLSHLHTADLPSKINFPHMRTIYPPLAQVLFVFSHWVFGDSIAGLKFLLVLADVSSILLLVLVLKRLRLLPEAVWLYAWSPLPILYFGLDGHIDALGIPFLLLFIYFAASNRHVSAAAALGFTALAKLYPLFIVPMLIRAARGFKKIWVPLIPVALLAIGVWLYFEPTGGLYESLAVYSATWEFNGSVAKILYLILGSSRDGHIASGILFSLYLIWLSIIDRSLIEKAFLAFLGFIILTPVVQPWYLTWLAALVAVRWSLSVFVFLGLSSVSNFVVYEYRLSGVWQDQWWLLLIQYLPFYALLVWEVMQGRFSLSATKLSLEQ